MIANHSTFHVEIFEHISVLNAYTQDVPILTFKNLK